MNVPLVEVVSPFTVPAGMVRGDLSDADEYTNVHHHWQHGPSRAIGWLLSRRMLLLAGCWLVGCYFYFLLVVGIGAAMSMYSIDTNAAGDNTHSALVFLNRLHPS